MPEEAELLDAGFFPLKRRNHARWAKRAGLPVEKCPAGNFWAPAWFDLAVRFEEAESNSRQDRMQTLVGQHYRSKIGGRTIARAKKMAKDKREIFLLLTEYLLSNKDLEHYRKRAYNAWIRINHL